MGLETPTWIDDLVPTNPPGTDVRSQGDDHIRNLKTALKNTFPNATKAFYFPIVTDVSSSPYALPSTDRNVMLRVDASGSAITITLPAAATMVAGASVRVIRVTGSNTITVDPDGAELINGAATLDVGPTAYDALVIECTGTAWTAYAASTPIPGAGAFDTVVLRTFTSTSTYTPTSGMVYCIVEAVGGGGGGGGSKVPGVGLNAKPGGGGGAGAYSRRVLSAATIGVSQAVTIGAAGSAGAGGTPTAGGNGGTTSLGSLVTAGGGTGGSAGSGVTGSDPVSGGAGGAAGTGTIAVIGAAGGDGFVTTNISMSGGGGSGPFGPGGTGRTSDFASALTGRSGGGRGSGGGGGAASTAASANGGAGTAGAVYITEFIS